MDAVSWLPDQDGTQAPAVEAQILNHCTAREVLTTVLMVTNILCARVPIQLPTKQMVNQTLLGGSWLTLDVESPMHGLPLYRTRGIH